MGQGSLSQVRHTICPTSNYASSHAVNQMGQSRTILHAASFEGNYREYEEDLKRRKGVDAETPHRIQYKKLVRQ